MAEKSQFQRILEEQMQGTAQPLLPEEQKPKPDETMDQWLERVNAARARLGIDAVTMDQLVPANAQVPTDQPLEPLLETLEQAREYLRQALENLPKLQ